MDVVPASWQGLEPRDMIESIGHLTYFPYGEPMTGNWGQTLRGPKILNYII